MPVISFLELISLLRFLGPHISEINIFFCEKGSLVHVAPACAGSKEGSDHFGSYVRSLSLHLCKWLFLGLEPMTSWSKATTLPLRQGSHISEINIFFYEPAKILVSADAVRAGRPSL
jgi:hypothetical protein